MRINKPVGSKDRLVEIFQKVNHVKLNENLLEMGGVNLNADSVLNMAFSQLVNKKLSVEQSNTQGSGDENFVQLICIDPQGNNISFVFRAITSEGDQDGVYSLDAAELTEFGFDSQDGEETIDLDENALQQFNSQHADELLSVVEEYVDVEEPSDAAELGEAVKLIDAIKKDSYPYGGGNDRLQTGQNYGDKKPTNDKVRVKSPELDKFVQEDANSLLHYSQGARDAGALYPQAQELGVTNQQILKNALKDAGVELLDIQPSQAKDTFWLIFNANGKKYKGLINKNYGNAAKVVGGIKKRLDANSMLPIEEFDKPAMKLIQQAPGGSTAGGIKQLDEMDKPIFAASSIGGVVEGEFSDDISGKQASPEIEPFRPKQFPGMYDELPVDNEPVEEVSPEKRELILKAYENLLKTKPSPTYQEVMDEIDRITGKKKEKTRNNMIPKDFEHIEDLWENQPSDGKNAAIVQAIQNVKKRLGVKFLSLGLDEYKRLVKAEIDNIKKERELSGGNLGFSMNEDEKSDYPDPIGKKFKPKKHYPKKKQKQDTTVKISESTDQDKYEDVVFLQGDEAFQPLEILDTKGEDAALEYLKQWHSPGQHMGSQELGHGSSDKTYEKDGYIMSWNPSIGYIGLQYDLSQLNEEIASKNVELNKFYDENKDLIEDAWTEYLSGMEDSIMHIKYLENCEDCFWEWMDEKYWDESTQSHTLNSGVNEEAEPNAQKGIEDIDSSSPGDEEGDENPEMTQLEKDNPDVYPDGWKEMDGMFMNPENPMYKKMHGLDGEPDVEQLTQDKEEVGDMHQGGKADGKLPTDFDSEQILKGMKVELEHTDNPMIAIEIVMDHLAEIPDYYNYLADMEKQAGVADVEGGEKSSDKEMTDTLLGFKPHNVGDEIEGEEEVPEEDELGEQEDVFGRLGDILRPQKPEPEEEPEEKLPEGLYESQIKLARETLSNRNVPTGMTKKEATQILVKHLIK